MQPKPRKFASSWDCKNPFLILYSTILHSFSIRPLNPHSMKSTTILLSLAVLLILAGCQIAKAPENGAGEGEGDGASPREVVAPAVEEDAQAQVSDAGEVFVNPNYDAKLDGSPTDAPKDAGKEENIKSETDNYVPFILPEPEKE